MGEMTGPRVPRDPNRPFLFTREQLDNPDDPRLVICPGCGMTDPGNLDGEIRGWPAHRSCQEWLGDWKPEYLPGSEHRPMRPGRREWEDI
jgi:hypothetical protein